MCGECRRLAARSRQRIRHGCGKHHAGRRLRSSLEISGQQDAGFDATPVIADGVIYIGDSNGTFHAVKLADGKRVWTKDFADGRRFRGRHAMERVGFMLATVNSMVQCLAASDGKENGRRSWKARSTRDRRRMATMCCSPVRPAHFPG